MELTLLNELIIVFALSIVVFIIFSQFKIPSIVGFLLTGILAGPHGLGLIKSISEVETLADIGIVLLLFTIGMEFSFGNLMKIKKSVLWGGTLQVFFTTVTFFAISAIAGKTVGESIFLGFLVSLSSTAIVMKIMQERAEIDSPHGRTTLGILIYQDIIVVPMMLITPLLAGVSIGANNTFLTLLMKGIGIIGFVIICAKWIVPSILYRIAKTKNRELFLLSIIVICFSVAWITSSMGLSLALGAFLAGLIISESEFSHEALSHVIPLRDVFTSVFFIMIGMLVDVKIFAQYPVLIILLILSILIIKSVIAGGATLLLGFPISTAILVGIKLSQVGEFSFILSSVGERYGLMNGTIQQVFLAVSILTMAITPFLITGAPRMADAIVKLPLPTRLKKGVHYNETDPKRKKKTNHIIIIGYGLNGRNLARAALKANIQYTIIEANAQTVRTERKLGEPIIHGDATHESVIEYAGIKEASVVVIAISDPAATRKMTRLCRRLNNNVYIIVRTRYVQEVGHLYELGASEVIPEEFETSIEIFTKVLEIYDVSRNEIEKTISDVREDGYKLFMHIPKEARMPIK